MKKKYILNGWISPEGEIFECELMGHTNLAHEIANERGFYVDPTPYCDMWRKGYIRFFGNPNSPAPSVTFDKDQRYDEDDNLICLTQKQILAQGKLMKQFHKRKTKGGI